MKIDNGEWRHLVIAGVFDGLAGLSRGVLAFIPTQPNRKVESARAGTLDGEPVRLTIERDGDGPVYLAKFEPLT